MRRSQSSERQRRVSCVRVRHSRHLLRPRHRSSQQIVPRTSLRHRFHPTRRQPRKMQEIVRPQPRPSVVGRHQTSARREIFVHSFREIR